MAAIEGHELELQLLITSNEKLEYRVAASYGNQ